MLNHMVKYCASRISVQSRGVCLSIFIGRASPDRAGARPYPAQLRITSLSRATPDNFCSNLSSFSSVQLFDEKEACRNQEHRNQARCKHSSDYRRPHHLPGNGSGT